MAQAGQWVARRKGGGSERPWRGLNSWISAKDAMVCMSESERQASAVWSSTTRVPLSHRRLRASTSWLVSSREGSYASR